MNASALKLTGRAAQFAATLDLASVPADAKRVARECLQDFVGVTLAGVPEDASRLALAWLKEEGTAPIASVFGTDVLASASNAALVNGTAGHALDLDDVCLAMRGHPTTVVGPAVMAVAEAIHAGGSDTLAGYIAGVELVIAMGFGMGRTHYPAGWHSTATLGTVGAAAGVARVLGLDTASTQHALGIAASFASGMRCNFGSMTKPLHAGHAARNGVVAASLAAKGFTANAGALEAPLGFFALFSDDPDIDRVASRLGRTWSLVEPGMCIKRHPCCYGTHHAIDAILGLRAEHGLTPEAVRKIVALVAPGGMAALIHNRPVTGLQGKFSLPYTLGAALADGALTLGSFSDAAVARPAVRALMDRIECREAEGTPVGGDDPRFAEVTLHLEDGRTLVRRVEHPRGSPQQPLTQEELDRKFLDCASLVLDDITASLALDKLHAFERLKDLRELTRALGASVRR